MSSAEVGPACENDDDEEYVDLAGDAAAKAFDQARAQTSLKVYDVNIIIFVYRYIYISWIIIIVEQGGQSCLMLILVNKQENCTMLLN